MIPQFKEGNLNLHTSAAAKQAVPQQRKMQAIVPAGPLSTVGVTQIDQHHDWHEDDEGIQGDNLHY